MSFRELPCHEQLGTGKVACFGGEERIGHSTPLPHPHPMLLFHLIFPELYPYNKPVTVSTALF